MDVSNQGIDIRDPVSYELRLETGAPIGPLSKADILNGLRAGWIRLDDEVRQEGGSWNTIRYSLCEAEFDFAVLADSAKAYEDLFRFRSRVGGGIAGALIGLGLGVSSIGSSPDNQATGSSPTLFVGPLRILPWISIPGLLAAFVSGWIGGAVGRLVGKSKADRYRLPPARTPLPIFPAVATDGHDSSPLAPPTIRDAPSTPRWVWAFAIACGVIPVVTLGGAIPGALGLGSAGVCLAVGRSASLSTTAKIGTCAAIVIGSWLFLVLLWVGLGMFR
jgi:hypothetical protein